MYMVLAMVDFQKDLHHMTRVTGNRPVQDNNYQLIYQLINYQISPRASSSAFCSRGLDKIHDIPRVHKGSIPIVTLTECILSQYKSYLSK